MKQAVSAICPESDLLIAKSGDDALASIERDKLAALDLALIDFHMPGIDGLQLATKLREIRSDLRIVLCTANAQHSLSVRAEEMGVSVLTKPVTEDKLRSELGTEAEG